VTCLIFDGVRAARGDFVLSATGTFGPGVHLVSGRVGSGKSTFASLAAGISSPDSGRVERTGVRRAMLSLQFPEWHLTGLTLAGEVRSYGLEPAPVLAEAGLFGRAEDDPLALSRGELRRLHLACIRAGDWDLLILDEPFSGLDCREKLGFCRWIGGRRTGIVIVCTHEAQVLPRVDRLWELRGGDLVELGPVPEAIPRWGLAPPAVRALVAGGQVPSNLAPEDLEEAACRTRG